MGELRCVDGSVLSVLAVACRDRAGQPYEITLNLARDSMPFATVGQRCGHEFAVLADRLTKARLDPAQAADWPDPDDRFPSPSGQPAAGPAAAPARLGGYLPGEAEYFALRSRDRVDLPGSGELRCVLRSAAVWVGECAGTGHAGTGVHVQAGQHLTPGQRPPGQQGRPGEHRPPDQRTWPVARDAASGRGQWRLSRRAVVEAWGTGGIGVRAVLTSAELVAFLDTVLTEPEGASPTGAAIAGGQATGRPGGAAVPFWRQRGRVPDGIGRISSTGSTSAGSRRRSRLRRSPGTSG